jgi:hypothetical protein
MEDFRRPGGQQTDRAISSSYIINVMTGTEDIQWETSPSFLPMELDQPGGPTDEHCYVSSSKLPLQAQAQAQDQAQAQAQEDTEPQVSTSVLSTQSVVIHKSTMPDAHG